MKLKIFNIFDAPTRMKVIVSNGSYKFHLAPLASELAASGNLAGFFTAGYPKGIFLMLLRALPSKGVQRLVQRREAIPEELVHAFNLSEFFFKAADLLLKGFPESVRQKWQVKGFEYYAAVASKRLQQLDFDVYHYRNCYGLGSAKLAREKGKITICDHSIAHPYAISYINSGQGVVLPPSIPPQPLSLLEECYLDDFEHADAILVNSDFVKSTFIACGFDARKVHVVYWGVDKEFLEFADQAIKRGYKRRAPEHLLFCGLFCKRKGGYQLMDALRAINKHDWTLTIAGGIDPSIQADWEKFYGEFPGKVNNLGILSREDLANTLVQYSIFVFPSLVEGSARVIFEAMACGCFVLTTPSSGSIVEEGLQGSLTEPGSSAVLGAKLNSIFDGCYDHESIGRSNQQVIRQKYRQDQYASTVLGFYDQLNGK